MLKKTAFCLLLFALAACSSSKTDEKPLARVYDRYLYPSDVKGVVPEGLSAEDSLQRIRSYIDDWIRKAIVLNKAKANIAVNQKDFRRQVSDYRNSLMIYYYEQGLVDQQLDTLVGNRQLRAYYEEHKESFRLGTDVYRIAYTALSAAAPDMIGIQSKLLKPSADDLETLTRYFLQHASRYTLTDTSWYSLQELQGTLPVGEIDGGKIAPGRVFEIKDKNTVFLIAFRELRKKGSLSPFSVEKENIRHLILNQRRLDLLSAMENKVFDEALKNNEFEIY